MDSNGREIIMEKESNAFGGLFQEIILEMKNSTPLWEDLTSKSTKLHSSLRTTIQAISAFLDAFQKIADAATSTRGATKDIGTSLTRICMRHKALEAKMKTFASSILDCLILPLQERIEEWKRTTAHLDKEHSKEYKRARADLKKRSMETLRLQKKLRKGTSTGAHNGGLLTGSFTSGTLPRSTGSNSIMHSSLYGDTLGPGYCSSSGGGTGNSNLNRMLEIALRETTEKRQAFEENEKQAIRTALVEERSRFCLFVSFFKPVVDEEIAMLSELTHVQEAMEQLEKQSADPFALPPASEQVISDLKGSCDSGTWSFQTPPSSPSSLGSRKSSMCSISSVNSSSSGSAAHSPSHHQVQNRNILQQPRVNQSIVVGNSFRYPSVSSQDSGFMSQSQDHVYANRYSIPNSHYHHQAEGKNNSNPSTGGNSSNSSTPSSPYPPGNSSSGNTTATWPNLQDSLQFERAANAILNERPHTISSAYERGHQRPPLTVYTFQPPIDSQSAYQDDSTPVLTPVLEQSQGNCYTGPVYQSASEVYGILRGKRNDDSRPPVPKRCSSLERPSENSKGLMGPPPPKTFKMKKSSSKNSNKGSQDSLNSLKPEPILPDFNEASSDMIVPQPVYVNMHELNQMASAKLRLQQQQHQHNQHNDLPPPPPELMGSNTNANKMELIGGDQNPSYGSSSTGSTSSTSSSTLTANTMMSTNTTTTLSGVGDEAVRTSYTSTSRFYFCSCDDGRTNFASLITTVSSFSTLPRNMTMEECPTCTRPRYTSKGGSKLVRVQSEVYGHLGGRQSRSKSQEKPLPPVRRSSSISSSTSSRNSPSLGFHQQSQSKQPSNNIYGNISISTESLPPPPGPNGNVKNHQQNSTDSTVFDASGKRISVADTVKSLTEKHHQPLSPNMVRRSQSMKQTSSTEAEPQQKQLPNNKSNHCQNSNWNSNPQTQSQQQQQPVQASLGSKSNLIQMLSDKITSNLYSNHTNTSTSPPRYQQQQQQQQPPQPTYGHIGNPHAQIPNQYYQQQQQQPLYGHIVQTQSQEQSHYHSQSQSQSQPVYGHIMQQQLPQQTIYHQQQVQVQSQSLSATNSPRHPRRFSEELLKTTASFVQNRVLGNKTPPPVVTSKEIFVQTLNAKLSQMRVGGGPGSPPLVLSHSPDRRGSAPAGTSPNSHKSSFASKLVASVGSHSHNHKGNHNNSFESVSAAHRVRQWITSKTVPDPSIVRESLMDQIRRGTKLKTTRSVNDRSAPKIYH